MYRSTPALSVATTRSPMGSPDVVAGRHCGTKLGPATLALCAISTGPPAQRRSRLRLGHTLPQQLRQRLGGRVVKRVRLGDGGRPRGCVDVAQQQL